MEVEALQKITRNNYQQSGATAVAMRPSEWTDELQAIRVPEHHEAGEMAEHSSKTTVEQNAMMEKYLRNHEQEVTESMLARAFDAANASLSSSSRMLEYKVHAKTNRVMVKIINKETHEVIREIPPEKTLDVFAKVLELAGLLVDEKR